jgi:2,3-dihydro-2,3-dihydroxybenzoate dehydrogenase
MDGIKDKVAFVTGAAAGIGAAVAHTLARHGAGVAAVDLDQAGLNALTDTLPGPRDHACYLADVRDPNAVEAVVDRAEAQLGPIGILVNVAGVLRTGSVLDTSDEDWAAVFAVNASGVFHTSRAAGRRMVSRGEGCIVTVASNAAGVPRAEMSAYAASKAAAAHFTRCLALEFAPHGIRCNIVAPGSTDTAMLRSMGSDGHPPQSAIDGSSKHYRVGIPLRKLARPDEVAEAVLFLASEQASHITMQNLYVDGGAALGA